MNRWIVALAVVAAVSAAVAIVPPGGTTARGIRVERMQRWSSDRPMLVRISVEDGGTRNWHAPAALAITARDATGVVHTANARRTGRGPWLMTVLPAMRAPVTLAVRAEGITARTTIQADAISPAFVLGDSGRSRMDLAVEGYVLTPEIGAAVIFSAGIENAGRTVDVRGDDPTLAIGPERTTLDACGMSTLYARAAGLAAPVVATINGGERRFRIPLVPGAVTTRVEGENITVAHALGGLTAYVLTGDARGPLRWLPVVLEASTDRAATAQVRLLPNESWAIASASADFDRVSGAWRSTPPGLSPCAATPLGDYFARISAAIPPIPSVALAYDGAAVAVEERDARRDRARKKALWVTALALSALSALMLAAARNRDGTLEREGLTAGSGAAKIAAFGVVALAAMAFAIAVAVQLRT